jgi:hypothetical protein
VIENETDLGARGGKRSRKTDLFIAALLAHSSIEAAAAAAGISRATAWRWVKDPIVIRRCHEARRDAMNRAIARLQEAATGAVDCLCEIQSKGESESARVSAARCILEQALRAVELGDVQERISRLEAIAKSRWKGSWNDREDQAAARPAGGVNGPM